MELQTVVKLDEPDFHMEYETPVMMLGSCFVENIGEKLNYFRFNVDTNPCGIAYNPLSVSACLKLLMEKKLFRGEDLLMCDGKWVSLSHHGRFSDSDEGVCLRKINDRLEESATFLRRAKVLVVTWGTAWVFHYRTTGQVVANCHKLPARDFERSRLEVDTIVDEYTTLLEELQKINPYLKILFTVSPIRHWKDGAHGNQLSKAVLLLAIDELISRFEHVSYFPSYEIVMDELRDYRFYAGDMLHISSQGIEYIWEKFRDLYIPVGDREKMKQVDKWNKLLLHRPLDGDNDTNARLKANAVSELQKLGFPLEK